MFELLVLVLFVWFFVGAIRLAFQVTWRLAKVAALILSLLALPMLIAFMLLAGGFVLLLPVILVAAAFGILRACV